MFFWIFEVAIVNSFILYNIRRRDQGLKNVTHKAFRKSLVRQLVGKIRNKNSRKRELSTCKEGISLKKSQMVKQKIVQCAATGK